MAENNEFKVPLIKSTFTIKKVSVLRKAANALIDDKDSEIDMVKIPLLNEEETEQISEESDSSTEYSAKISEPQAIKIPSSTSPKKASSSSKTATSSSSKTPPPAPVSIPYKEPEWAESNETSGLYSLDVIKQGVSIGEVSLKGKACFVVGRLVSCDIQLEHPSISRHHAVLQYKRGVGWHLFDLDSTHATLLNKRQVPPRRYMRLHVGHVIKFGGSSRLMVLTGPEEDQEEEGELKQKKVVKEEGGCGWGMVEAEEEEDDGVNPFAMVEDDSAYKDDPKKALKKVYQREDVEGPQFEFEGVGLNRTCKLELPLDGPNGEALVAEVRVAGSKREAEVACALEGCRLLELHGLLTEVRHESVHKKMKRTLQENDFYEDDDDLYLDRTGDVERKRKERMRRVNQDANEVFSHESLVEEMAGVVAEMDQLQVRLEADVELQRRLKEEEEEEDALEMFMKGLKAGGLGAREKMDIKKKLLELKHSRAHLERLIDVSKPTPILLAPPPSKPDSRSVRSVKVPILPVTSPVEGKKDEEMEEKEKEVEESEDIVMEDNALEEIEKVSEIENSTNSDSTNGGKIIENSDLIDNKSTPQHTTTNNNNKIITSIANFSSDRKMSKDESDQPNIAKDENGGKNENAATNENGGKDENAAKTTKMKKSKSSKKKQSASVDEQSEAAVYSSWLPPSNQSGDGKTTLNKRLGY